MRIVVIALAMLCAACTNPALLRVTVEAGAEPPPSSLRITLVDQGGGPASRTFSPVTFPASLIVRGLPAESVCVQAEGLDDAGSVVAVGSATVTLALGRTTPASIQLSAAGARCSFLGQDLATGTPDLAIPTDLAPVQVCPAGNLFCDDFEHDNFNLWTATPIKDSANGAIAPSMAHAAHGIYSAHATGNAATGGGDNYIELEKNFMPPLAPPIALRANVWSAAPLGSYTMVIALYDTTTNGFSIGGDNNGMWVLTENQALGFAPDRHSTLATPGPGWHCVELTVDAAGMVSVYVDSARIIGPFQRTSAVSYSTFDFGIPRTIVAGTDVYIDDVAIGPSRLYCPP